MGKAKPSESIPQSLPQLIELFESEIAARRQLQRILVGASIVLVCLSLVAPVIMWALGKPLKGGVGWESLSSILFVFGISAAVSTRHRAALTAAASNPDPALTGYFMLAAGYPEADIAKMATDALVIRLPSLTESEYTRLTPETRTAFLKSITPNRPIPYLREAISACQKCAGSEATLYLERLANAPPTKDPEFEKLQISTRLVLADVRIRAAKRIIEQQVGAAEPIIEAAIDRMPEEIPRRELFS